MTVDFQEKKFLSYVESISNNDLYNELNFNSFTDEEFNNKFGNMSAKNVNLSIYHLNIRSLNANADKLLLLLSSLQTTFDIICLSEIWSCNITFYNNILQDYKFSYALPPSSKAGGVGIFFHKNLKATQINELEFPANDHRVENLWFNVEKNRNKYIIGALYRHPRQSITPFKNILIIWCA